MRFSRILKIAKVVLIFKAGDKKLTLKYKSISIMGHLSKMFEKKIVHKKLI